MSLRFVRFGLIAPVFALASSRVAPVHESAVRVGHVTAIAPMSAARAAHTSTALLNGDVLVVGGFSRQEGVIGDAELFDARGGRFRATGQPRQARQSHSATRLPDGRVLIAGGYDASGTVLASAELFTPSTGRFTPAGEMRSARSGQEAVLLRDGRVLIIGGVGPGWSFLRSAEVFDPRTGTFTSTGDMRVARESHVAVLLGNGRVLVAGGHHGRGADVVIEASSEMYDPSTGRFSAAASMGTPRHKHDGVVLADGSVLVIAGADARDAGGVYSTTERYDPVADRFTPSVPVLRGRYKHRGTTIVLRDGRLLLAGGAEDAEERQPTTGAGTVVPSTAALSGQFSAATLLPDGRVLITGGYGHGRGATPVANAWIYEPGR